MPYRAKPLLGGDSLIARRPSSSFRDTRIDFVRGLALLIVYSDHVTGNVLWHFTPGRWGFSDMAEVFVFLSGYVCGMSFQRRLVQSGFLSCQARATFRAAQLYVVNILMLVASLPLIYYWIHRGLTFSPSRDVHIRHHLADPLTALLGVLELSIEPSHFAILPLYMVLLLGLPLILVCSRAKPYVTLVSSLLVYLSVQYAPSLVVLPEPWRSAWYFNPLAWQFLFYGGAMLGARRAVGNPLPQRNIPLLIIAVIALEVAFLATALLPEQSIPFTRKAELGPLRVLHFVALVIVGRSLLPSSERLDNSRLVHPIIACGRNSLLTYCFGGYIAIVFSMILYTHPSSVIWQILANLVGWCACFLAATGYERWRYSIKTEHPTHRPHTDPPQAL